VRPSGLTNENPVDQSEIININDANYKSNARSYSIPRSNVAMCALDSCFNKGDNGSILNIEQI